MRVAAPLSYDRGCEQVEDMMKRGLSFARVEDAIDGAQLPRDYKAALWLLAWSLRDPLIQRQDARLTLSLLGARASRGG